MFTKRSRYWSRRKSLIKVRFKIIYVTVNRATFKRTIAEIEFFYCEKSLTLLYRNGQGRDCTRIQYVGNE